MYSTHRLVESNSSQQRQREKSPERCQTNGAYGRNPHLRALSAGFFGTSQLPGYNNRLGVQRRNDEDQAHRMLAIHRNSVIGHGSHPEQSSKLAAQQLPFGKNIDGTFLEERQTPRVHLASKL